MKPNLLLVSFTAALMGSSLSAEAQAPAAATPSPTGTLGAKTGLTKTELRKLIENTEWTCGASDESQIFFLRGGQMHGLGEHFYTVEAPDILRIYETDPTRDRKAASEWPDGCAGNGCAFAQQGPPARPGTEKAM